jgi:hypothetical protein
VKSAVAKAPAKKKAAKAPVDGTKQVSLLDMFGKRPQSLPVKRPLETTDDGANPPPAPASAAAAVPSTKPLSVKAPQSAARAKKARTETTSLKKLAKTKTGIKMDSGKHLLDSDDDTSVKDAGDDCSNNDEEDDEMERKKFLQSGDFVGEATPAAALEQNTTDELELCDVDFLLGDAGKQLPVSATPADSVSLSKPQRPELVSLIVARQQKRPREEDSSRPVSQASLHAFFNPEVAALYKKYRKATVTRTVEERGEWISMDVAVFVDSVTNEEISPDCFADLVKACVRQEIAAAATTAKAEEAAPAATPPPRAASVPTKQAKPEAIKMRTLDSWGFGKK